MRNVLLIACVLIFVNTTSASLDSNRVIFKLQDLTGKRKQPEIKFSFYGFAFLIPNFNVYRYNLAFRIPQLPHFIEEMGFEHRKWFSDDYEGAMRIGYVQELFNNRYGVLFNVFKMKYPRINVFPGLYYLNGRSSNRTVGAYYSYTDAKYKAAVAKINLRLHMVKDLLIFNCFAEYPVFQKFISEKGSGFQHGDPKPLNEGYHLGINIGIQLALIKVKLIK